MTISFVIYGEPRPQGSTRAFVPRGWTRPIITSDNKKLKPWRQEVCGTAKAEMERLGLAMAEAKVPVRVEVTFYFERPASTKKNVVQKATRPDVDKLARAMLDSLAGIVFKMDSQVSQCWVNKEFGSPSRAEVRVTVLNPFERSERVNSAVLQTQSQPLFS